VTRLAETAAAAWAPRLLDDGADPIAFAESLQAEVGDRLTGALANSRDVGDGSSILTCLGGLDPLYLVPALEALATAAKTPTNVTTAAAIALRALRALCAQPDPSRLDPPDVGLPAEHPLDYDWRFHPHTRQSLCDELRTLGPPSVLLLGCPTLAVDLPGRLDGHVTLVDDNPALPRIGPTHGARTVQQICADLVAQPSITEGLEADCVIADPPFYPHTMAAFIYAAATGSKVDAMLYLILPSRWTRPSATGDTAQALVQAEQAGYQLRELRAGAARYVRPIFERAAHATAGWPGVPDGWRTADIAVLQLRSRPLGPPPAGESDRHLWCEVMLAGLRWRVRTDGDTATTRPPAAVTPRLLAIGSRLRTVSRRDKIRADANVITNDHRAFTTDQPRLLLDAMQALAAGTPVEDAIQRRLNRPLTGSEQTALADVLTQLAPNR